MIHESIVCKATLGLSDSRGHKAHRDKIVGYRSPRAFARMCERVAKEHIFVDVRKMRKADEEDSISDYDSSAYSWVTEPVSFVRPDKLLGKLRLFDVPDRSIVRIANDETDWIFNYPAPQGEIRYNPKTCDLLYDALWRVQAGRSPGWPGEDHRHLHMGETAV